MTTIQPTRSGPDTHRIHTRVLVADDEESMRYFVAHGLERHGFEVEAVDNGAAATERFDARSHDVAVLDLRMPGLDGIEVLRHIHNRDPEAIVILITAFGSIASAVEAMKLGAFEYVTKPFEIDELVLLIDRAIGQRTTLRENRDLRQLVDTRTEYAGLIGQSAAMRAVFDRIDLLRNSDATVLIRGESGTGKELVARAIHMESRRAHGQFVAINCAAIPPNLFENELFGHEPGAYTGATTPKAGLCSRADGGTLFIDEVSEMPLATQAKLERFLQEKSILRLGGSKPIKVDVRVCAATNKDLEQLVAEQTLRREFYFRLNVVGIQLPALRERREDVPALIDHFLGRMRSEGRCELQGFSVEAALALSRYDWPGNVRELQNTLERLAVMNPGREVLDVADLPTELVDLRLSEVSARPAFKDAVQDFERHYFTQLLQNTRGNISEVARISGLSRGHLHRKIKQLGIEVGEYRA